VLRGRIDDGDYPPGGRLPSESDLAEELKVSRATVRAALASLAAEGYVIRKHGAGTYVSERVMEISTSARGAWEFYRMIEASGREPSIQPVLVETRPSTEQEATALGLAPGETVLSMVRVFHADGSPVIHSTNVIPALLLLVDCDAYEAELPIPEFLRRYCDQEIAYYTSDVSATRPEPDVAATLNADAGSPMLRFVDVFYDEDHQPLAFGFNFYNDKALRMRVFQSWG
jgi:DNA-binding GntR family transcriptional regulator